jgi:hypothetical protein
MYQKKFNVKIKSDEKPKPMIKITGFGMNDELKFRLYQLNSESAFFIASIFG